MPPAGVLLMLSKHIYPPEALRGKGDPFGEGRTYYKGCALVGPCKQPLAGQLKSASLSVTPSGGCCEGQLKVASAFTPAQLSFYLPRRQGKSLRSCYPPEATAWSFYACSRL